MAEMSRQVEERLIAAARSGDRLAAEQLIRQHQRGLYGFMLRISGRADVAEDVVQEAFIRAMAHLDRFNPQYRFSTWIFTIARRVYLNMMEKRTPRLADLEAAEAAGAFSRPDLERAGDSLASSEGHLNRVSRLMTALQALPEIQRQVVVLFHQCHWPLQLISEELELPLGTVKSHLHRARIRLRELIGSAEQDEPEASGSGRSARAAPARSEVPNASLRAGPAPPGGAGPARFIPLSGREPNLRNARSHAKHHRTGDASGEPES